MRLLAYSFVIGLAAVSLAACSALEVGLETPSATATGASAPPTMTTTAQAPATVTTSLPPSAVASPLPGSGQILITAPAAQAVISGGVLHLEGYSDYVFESTLSVALCGEGGFGGPHPVCGTSDNVIAAGVVMLQAPDVGQPGPFTGDLPYSVAEPVQARLVVYSLSPRDGGLLNSASQAVQLRP